MTLHEKNTSHEPEPSSETPTLREEALESRSAPERLQLEKHPAQREPESDVVGHQEDLLPEEGGTDSTPEEPDVYIVDWDGPNDPQNPKNWSKKKKWGATLIVSAFTFISPVSSSLIAPASGQVAEQFGITSNVVEALVTSIFVCAYALGPLVLGPLSEMFGRSRVLQLANLWYLAWNLGCGFSQNTGQLLAFRFLAGLGGSAPLSIGGGVLGDLWRPEERGQAIALYSLAPLLGPVIGPAAASWIAQKSTWRWCFWATSIVDAFIQGLGVLFLKETFAPVLLERKAERIRQSMDPEKGKYRDVRTPYDNADRTWQSIMKKALIRPFALFVREPIVQALGMYMAFVYGLLYLFLTSLPDIFTNVYHEEIGIAGLNYFALGIGLTGASQVNARMLDRIYSYYSKKNGGVGRPEFRLPSMIPGTIFLPIGLFLTGWTSRSSIHWIVPDIGIAFVGAGTILNFQSIQTYVIDTFTLHAASALAAVTFFRSLAGFGFPLFAPAMYNALGYGKGDSILGVVAIVVGCPAPWLLWVYGERLRQASRYARK
ncbi:MFS polyamine transporter [Obba rivulosa]|uniref:MFS polyamine transporter n=1 Tax=Obba rivulosa TaxID=1052685 RepID=A0A8E2AYZ3_9APHY|nr:MFS polyamine transporter [Obba rivulosa]